MSTTPTGYVRVMYDPAAGRSPTAQELVAALIAEGGEIVEVATDELTGEESILPVIEDGRYLVFPIPVESAEAKETPR